MIVAPGAGGGTPVVRLVDLAEPERRAIVYLRLWCSGPAGQTEVWQNLVARLGAREAAAALRRFEALLATTARLARRPMMRRGLHCTRAGADECLFARLLALAARGPRQDTRLIAALIASPAAAEALSSAAEDAAAVLAPCAAQRAGPRAPSHVATRRPQ
jgi:hypothetical protein